MLRTLVRNHHARGDSPITTWFVLFPGLEPSDSTTVRPDKRSVGALRCDSATSIGDEGKSAAIIAGDFHPLRRVHLGEQHLTLGGGVAFGQFQPSRSGQ